MAWQVSIKHDVIRGWWHEELHCYVYLDKFWVLATDGKTHFIHFYQFWDDYDAAAELVARIRAAPDFTPEGRQKIWMPIRDTKEFYAPRKWWRLKRWWLEYGR